ALTLLLIPAVWLWVGGPIKSRPDAIFETESAYNYIQVIRREQCNYLLLNEGIAFHSFHCDDGSIPAVSVWSSMLAAPYFNPQQTWTAPKKMLVIGLAGGSIPQQYLRTFPDLSVDGIEPDSQIIDVGKEYFALDDPRINPIVGDGRYELNRTAGNYDVITIDAYRVPYIPWHLTTIEFFGEVKSKLSPNGVVAINVGRVPGDRRLSEAMTASLLQVFPTVHTVDIPGSLNTILFASVKLTQFDSLDAHLKALPPNVDPLLPAVLHTVQSGLQPTTAADFMFTDDVAPVETIVDSLVIRYFLNTNLEASAFSFQ
ncbi:MAG: spermidine synthase, partial [Candidatus Promineifilaceae bacterium]